MSRITGIEINKYFKKLLQEDEVISSIVEKKNIQPLVLAPTSFPFISFTHDEIITNYVKAGDAYDEVYEIVACVSNDYAQSIAIVSRVREIFEYKMYQDENIYISDFTVVSISEGIEKDTYIQNIVFKFQVHSKK